MIENEAQYQAAREQAERLEQEAYHLTGTATAGEAAREQAAALREQLTEYDQRPSWTPDMPVS